jgi:hypothetical protein
MKVACASLMVPQGTGYSYQREPVACPPYQPGVTQSEVLTIRFIIRMGSRRSDGQVARNEKSAGVTAHYSG